MNCAFRQSLIRGGFTLVEIAAALAILAGLLASVLVVMNQAVGASLEIIEQRRAFETARDNLESLLTVSAVSDQVETGYSERFPEIRWELRVEPFYEPISNRMWVRAVSTAFYRDRDDQEQAVELEHWLTGLSAEQIKQILAQEELEEKILEELYGEEEKTFEEMKKVCLQQAGLDTSGYENLLERQRRQKVAFLIEKGLGKEYDQLVETLKNDESEYLQKLGVNFDQLNECIRYLQDNPQLLPSRSQDSSQTAAESGTDSQADSGTEPDFFPNPPEETPSEPSSPQEPDCPFDCSRIDPALKPILCQLTGCCCD
jgi:prepilin-type N-terminal cleavage/methylation domain-containing protein